ncbi:MAG: SapC family protein [Pseudomonadota bacterium]
MAKQSLFYEEVVPLTKERHMGWSVEQGKTYAFAAKQHSVPLMHSEFSSAALDLPIVFGKTGETTLPLVMLGMQAEKSLFVDKKGKFTGRYCPAFLRRYPFIFARGDAEEETFALCIDETFDGVDKKGKKGEALFGEDEEPSEYLKQIMEFSRVFEVDLRKTRAFTDLLNEHELLDPMNAQVSLADGSKVSLTGFHVVSRERLKQIDPELLTDLFQREFIELVYYHLLSLKNMEKLRDMVR